MTLRPRSGGGKARNSNQRSKRKRPRAPKKKRLKGNNSRIASKTHPNVLSCSRIFSSSMATGLEDEETTYVESNPAENFDSLRLKNRELYLDDKKKQELLALAPGDEKADLAPKVGKRTLKKIKKAEREKTKGDAWFGMKAPEVTEETRRELEVLQMRSALDPKRFYKKNDLKVLPKYFQVRTQIFSPSPCLR